MTKLQRNIAHAINTRSDWNDRNRTTITFRNGVGMLYYKGDLIAKIDKHGVVRINLDFVRRFPTPAVIDRLQAAGVDIKVHNNEIIYRGEIL